MLSNFIYTDANGIEALAEKAEVIVLSFSRREVESGLTGDAVDRLMRLSDSARFTRQFADRLLFQFEGFDDDPREIASIAECRRFMTSIRQQWDYWFHFSCKDPELQQLSLIVGLSVPLEVVPSISEKVTRFRINPSDISLECRKLYDALDALHELNGVGMHEHLRIKEEIEVVLRHAFL